MNSTDMNTNMWHSVPINEIITKLGTHPFKGLKSSIVDDRIKEYGFNVIRGIKRSIFMIFLDQFKSFLVLILIVAAIFSLILGRVKDASVILAIVLPMSILSFIQEYRAEKTITKLGILTNRSMIYALIVSVILQLLAIYCIHLMFDVKPLLLGDLALIVILSLTLILIDEARKTLKVKIY